MPRSRAAISVTQHREIGERKLPLVAARLGGKDATSWMPPDSAALAESLLDFPVSETHSAGVAPWGMEREQ